jgi:hypothetical protein
MATDFVHTTEIVDAVLAVLTGDGSTHYGGLPAAWHIATDDYTGTGEYGLTLLEHGDLSDYVTTNLENLSPAILVRGMGPKASSRGGVSGHRETFEVIRVIHLRSRDHSLTAAGALETNLTRARERYAKIIGKALFNDPHKRLATISSSGVRTPATLTCSDSAGAQIQNVVFLGWDLGEEYGSADSMREVAMVGSLSAPVWAIGCEFEVVIDTGGQG